MSLLKKCLVIPHNGLGDHINTISMCNYLSTLYNIVYHICLPELYENINLFYKNNNKIIVYKLKTNYDQNFFKDKLFNEVENIYILGFHQNNPFIKNLKNKKIYGLKNTFDSYTIPYSFYNQVNIDINVFYNFMIIPNILESNLLLNLLNNIDYYFISNSSSNGDMFSINDIIKKENIDINNVLIINPDKNIYNIGHKYFNLANNFIMKPIVFYIKIIENASKIIVSSNHFMSLILNLKVKTDHCYYISPYNYSYLFKTYDFKQIIYKYSSELYKKICFISKIKSLSNQHNLNYIIDDINKYKYHAVGIGDILNALCYIKNNIMSGPFIFPISPFQDTTYYPEPINALEFRLRLISDLMLSNQINKNRFLIVIPKDFKFDSLTKDTTLSWLIHYGNTYVPIYNIHVTSFKLNFNSINKNIIPKILLKKPYIIFNTKLRFMKNFDYKTLKEKLNNFFVTYKTKYTIVLLGEQIFGNTKEGDAHNIQTMYNELLQLKKNNFVLDLTTKTIINDLDYNLYIKDISIMNYAEYSICCGLGGHFCSSLAFAKNIITYSNLENLNIHNVKNLKYISNFDEYLSTLTFISKKI